MDHVYGDLPPSCLIVKEWVKYVAWVENPWKIIIDRLLEAYSFKGFSKEVVLEWLFPKDHNNFACLMYIFLHIKEK